MKETIKEQHTKYKNSGYSESGASYGKRWSAGWHADSRSPVEDIDMNLFTIRQRSRSLYMGSPIASSAIKTYLTNVVGSGLKCNPKIDYEFLGMSRDEAKAWERHTMREFGLWADKKFCDATKVNNFYEMQGLALVSWLLNGDCFALIDSENPTPYMPYSLRIHLIESDRVTNPNTTAFSGLTGQVWFNTQNGNRVYNGVEIDDNGGIIAYHVCNFYPNSFIPTMQQRKWTRVPAYALKTGMPNILHIMYSERPEQYRGVPLLAPVIESLKQLTRYTDAELMASVINGYFTAFITSGLPNADGILPTYNGEYEPPESNTTTQNDEQVSSVGDYELGPGNINHLLPGESVEIADPKRPSQNFDAFVSSMAKYIGAAIDVPYELILKAFGSSYSASRGVLLEAWKSFRMRRTWLARDFCQPVYELWLAEAIALGRISAPGFFNDPLIREAWVKADWNGPSPGQLDPVKEVQASELKVKNGFSSYEREAIELNGSDWDSNMETIIRENELLKEATSIYNPVLLQKANENPAP